WSSDVCSSDLGIAGTYVSANWDLPGETYRIERRRLLGTTRGNDNYSTGKSDSSSYRTSRRRTAPFDLSYRYADRESRMARRLFGRRSRSWIRGISSPRL